MGLSRVGEALGKRMAAVIDTGFALLVTALVLAIFFGLWVLPKLDRRVSIATRLEALEREHSRLEARIESFESRARALQSDPYVREGAARLLFQAKGPGEHWLFPERLRTWRFSPRRAPATPSDSPARHR